MALPLRLLLGRGPWLAIATVVGARSRRAAAWHRASGHRGRADHRVQPGRTAGPDDPGPGHPGARHRQNRLRRLRIEKDAAGYTGLPGQISLDVLRSR